MSVDGGEEGQSLAGVLARFIACCIASAVHLPAVVPARFIASGGACAVHRQP
jgi:dolichol kinase